MFKTKALHRDNSKPTTEATVRNQFTGLVPRGEGPKRSSPSIFKRWMMRAMLGLQLTTAPLAGGLAATAGCSEKQPEEKTTKTGQTDSNGNVTFEINGWRFTVSVSDFETGNPISGLVIMLTAKNEQGIYMIFDPQKRYSPHTVEATGIPNQQISGMLTQAINTDPNVTNVTLTKTGNSCLDLAQGGKIPQEILESPDFLKNNFIKVNEKVTLSELNDALSQYAGVAVGEAKGKVAEAGIVAFLTKTAAQTFKATLEKINLPILVLNLCTVNETTRWGNYYQSRCYQDTDTFSIYKLKPFDQIEAFVNQPWLELLIGFKTPFFIVLPEPDKNMWEPAYATVNAQIYLPGQNNKPEPTDLKIFNVDQVDRKLPSVVFGPTAGRQYRFETKPVEIDLNACANLNPTYKITAGAYTPLMINKYSPATSDPLTVKAKDDYSVDFYLQPSLTFNATCSNGYKTYYKPDSGMMNERGGMHHDVAVACTAPDGYQMTTPKVMCNSVMTIMTPDGSSIRGKVNPISIYGDHLVLNVDFNSIWYANIKTGKSGSIPSSQFNMKNIYNSNVWEGKFTFCGSDGSTYLFDIDTNQTTKLPITSIQNNSEYAQCGILSNGQIFTRNNYLYDLKGNLIEDINKAKKLEFDDCVQYIYPPLFFGSRIVRSGLDNACGHLVVTKLYEVGSGSWKLLPPIGWLAELNGDNIAYPIVNDDHLLVGFGLYNIPTTQTIMSPKVNGSYFNGGFKTTRSKFWSYWGDNVALLLRDNEDPASLKTVFVLDTKSGVLQKLDKEVAQGLLEKTVDIYDRKVAYARPESNKLGNPEQTQVWVCNF
ncbi:hypothetical protein HY988_07375 [Candidatus Micrarchaeota archaeon]|nr:hypothetical protein [Candidatus Micrarchaeota archaeon]